MSYKIPCGLITFKYNGIDDYGAMPFHTVILHVKVLCLIDPRLQVFHYAKTKLTNLQPSTSEVENLLQLHTREAKFIA